MEDLNFYKVSRYWNRVAYLVMHLGRKMVWDYTKCNGDILGPDDVLSETTEAILCDRC